MCVCVYMHIYLRIMQAYSFEELDIKKNELCALWDDFDCVYLKWHECDRDCFAQIADILVYDIIYTLYLYYI